VHAIAARMNLPAHSSYAHVSTFAADLGHTVLLPPLCHGGCLHLVEQSLLTDARALGAYFDEHAIDCLKIVPSHLSALLAGAEPARVLPRTLLVLGGEASSWDLVSRIRRLAPTLRIMNHYGPTETTVGVLTFEIDSKERPNTATVPIGYPLSNNRVYVLDAAMQPMPAGARGELYIGGAQVARGYLGNRELTAQRFVEVPFSKMRGERLYRTGDIVRQLPNGAIEFLGRTDHQLKVRGFRVELGEIEAAISEHHSVVGRVVVPIGDAAMGIRLAAYYSSTNDALSPEALRLYLQQRLPEYMVPSWFFRLDSIPLGPNGKVDRERLPAPEAAALRAGTVPRNATEQLVAGIWRELLGIEEVDVRSSFFELGGNSLLMVQLHTRLCELRPDTPPVAVLFERPTIEAIARKLAADVVPGVGASSPLPVSKDTRDPVASNDGAAAGPRLVELKAGDVASPPLFLVHQAGGLEGSYLPLAAHLRPEQPVYAIRADLTGMDGSVERLASRYIELIRKRSPRGPYWLAGASFGGLVVYEMAQQLCHQQETVGTVMQFDTEEPGRMNVSLQTNEEILAFLRQVAPQFVELLLAPRPAGLDPRHGVLPDAETFLDNFRRCSALRSKYRPQPYRGDVSFFRAKDRAASVSPFPQAGWLPLVEGNFSVVDVPGNHMGMLQSPNVEVLAHQVTSIIATGLPISSPSA
jgi:thioesterase domain-containing protein